MLHRVGNVGRCFVVVGLLLGATEALGQNFVTEYSQDFSSDPGWTTDQPGNYLWDSVAGTYHATTLNDHGGLPSPTRYAYTNVGYDGNSMRLEFDIRFDSIGWSAGVMFGLFDQKLNLWPSVIAPNADSIFGSFGIADGGMYITLYVCDSVTGCVIDQVVNVTSDNTWYRCTVEYSTQSQEATLILQDVATGVVAANLLIPGVTGLKPELDFLGFARDPSGNDCCPSCSGYACSAQATATIDNVSFSEVAACNIANSDDFEDGVINPTLWAWGGEKFGIGGCGAGSWAWTHEEIVAPDGYLSMRVFGPTSGDTFGGQAWVRTLFDYNNGGNHTINFTWEADINASHVDSYAIQITDGSNPVCNLFWYVDSGGEIDGPTWKNLYARYRQPNLVPSNWSIHIDGTTNTATLYDGPNLTGAVIGSKALPTDQPWHVRFIHNDGTSSGFPAGDNLLNVYDYCSTSTTLSCPPGGVLGWAPRASTADPRRETSCAVVNNRVYVFGDFSYSAINNRSTVYDPLSDTWSRLADIPTGRGMAAAAAVNGTIYLFAGNNCFSNCWLTTVEAYDPVSNAWGSRTALPGTSRGLLTATPVNGLIYIMGGANSYIVPTFSDNFIYNPSTDTWLPSGTSLPRPRSHHAAAVLGGKIYLIGGRFRLQHNASHNVPEVDVYDPATNTWASAAPLPTPRWGLSASVINGKLYAIGGAEIGPNGEAGPIVPLVEVYDPLTDSWSTATPLPGPRIDHCSAAANGSIHVIGGHDGVGALATTVASVSCPTPTCGDGILDPGEACDDGNNTDCDGCRGDCSATETGCGDTFVCGTEECDDGNNTACDGCDATCAIEFCGDGVLCEALGEECDDFNTSDGDGCSFACTIEAGFVCNGNPSVCCFVATPPTIEQIRNDSGFLVASAKNRFVSFAGGDASRQQAVRVRFVSLPGAFNVFDGTVAWVALPQPASELPGKRITDPVGTDDTFMAATLVAAPVFADWSTLGMVHVYDERVIPSLKPPGQPLMPAEYEIQFVTSGCDINVETLFSPPVVVVNAAWCDVAQLVVGEFRAPDGVVAIDDTLALLAKFGGAAGAPIKARAELLGVGGIGPVAAVDGIISVSDLLEVLAAFSGGSYPFAPPAP